MKELLWKGYFPFPPSINQTYKVKGKRLALNPNAITFSSYSSAIIKNERLGNKFLSGWLEVVMLIRPPVGLKNDDRSMTDAHNYSKLLLDVLQDHGVYKNDSVISPLVIGFGDESVVPIREINYLKARAKGNVAVKVLGGVGVFIYRGTQNGCVDLSQTHEIPEISYKKMRGIET